MLAGLVESGLSPDSEFLETLAPYVLIVLREKLGAVRSHYKRMTPVDPMWHLGTASQLEKYGASNMAQALRIAKAAGLD